MGAGTSMHQLLPPEEWARVWRQTASWLATPATPIQLWCAGSGVGQELSRAARIVITCIRHSVWSCSSSTSQRDTAACSLRVATSSATIWASPSPAPPQSVCDIFCEPILHSKTYKSVRQKQLIAKCCQKSGT